MPPAIAARGGSATRTTPIALLAACTALGPVATNIYLPALPAVQQFFGVSVAATQTSVSSYLIAFATGILFAGPLADRFGRRPVMLWGVALFALGSLLALLAPTLPLLVAARIVQALGSSAAVTVGRASVGDVYRGDELARMLATLTMIMMLGTTLSPYVGGLVAVRFGWHSCFALLLCASLVIWLFCLRGIVETRVPQVAASDSQALLQQGRKVLAQPIFFGYVVQAGLIYGIFLTFITVAPYVLVQGLHRPATEFGAYYLLLASGYFLGNFMVSRTSNRLKAENVMLCGLVLQVVGATGALIFAVLGYWQSEFIFLPQLPLAFGQGLALPHITARAVGLAPGFAGVASSMIGFSQQAIAAICVQAMGFAAIDSPLPVTWFCFLASMVAFGSFFLLRSSIVKA